MRIVLVLTYEPYEVRHLQLDLLNGYVSRIFGGRLSPYGAELFMLFPVSLLAYLDEEALMRYPDNLAADYAETYTVAILG